MLSDTLLLLALDSLFVAVSIFDPDGLLLYYNRMAKEMLNRKSIQVGHDVRTFNENEEIKNEIDYIFKSFNLGRIQPFTYQAQPYGKLILITMSPILDREDRFFGCVQSVIPLSNSEEE